MTVYKNKLILILLGLIALHSVLINTKILLNYLSVYFTVKICIIATQLEQENKNITDKPLRVYINFM